jgi:hypothetical protein
VVGSGQVAAGPTAERLDVLRHAGCRFAGVVVNRYRPLFPWIPINL